VLAKELTEEEFESMKKHTIIGETICKPLNCLQNCLDAVRHHHEKLNGTGYPDGLKGDEISLEARIIAVADIFDALYSDRPYRERLPLNKVKSIIMEEAQKGCLDKSVVDALMAVLNENLLKELQNSRLIH
jgi:putative two-component system response regulator